MITFASTFISGLSPVVEVMLKEDIPDVRINKSLDGLIVYTTHAPVNKLQQIPYFNNTFIVISEASFEEKDSTPSVVKKLYRGAELAEPLKRLPRTKTQTFRVVVSRENTLTSINKEIIKKVEHEILESSRLTINTLKADYEFWFLIRREGYAIYGVRVTGVAYKLKDTYAPGELKHELTYVMNRLSDPAREDVFLDPFAGLGGIVKSRAQDFPCEVILAGDQNPLHVTSLEDRYHRNDMVHVSRVDALDLAELQDESVDRIVTDPPWGYFDGQDIDFAVFYEAMIQEFTRVLVAGGIAVILTARKELFDEALRNCGKIVTEIAHYDILVSGKKARIYKLQAVDRNAQLQQG
jgi:23S rRNA G2445 N2-methylase RlmL